jgi:drug/metabolite transporter (DMT)-like permease
MKSYLKIIAAMLIWSTWGPMIRWLGLPPVVVLFYTSLFAGVFVPLVLTLRGDFPQEVFSLKSWHLFAGIALASIANNIAYFYALRHTSISNAVFTHYTAPVLVAVLAPFLIAERLQRVTLISLPVAVAGMALIILSSGGLDLNSEHLPGILAGTASGVAYALAIIFTRQLSLLHLNQKAILVQLWATVIMIGPAMFLIDYSLDLRTFVLLLITGVMHSTTASLMYYSALRQVLAQDAAVLGYIEPLAAILLAFFLLSESPSLFALFGGLLIILSGYLVVHARMHYEKRALN